MRPYFNNLVSFVTVLVLNLFLTGCRNDAPVYYDPRGPEFAGSESCNACHKEQHRLQQHSAHALALSPAALQSTYVVFEAPANTFRYADGSELRMEERDGKRFQIHYRDGKEIASYPFDLVFGNRHAQTAAFWNNGNAFQLPLSWYGEAGCWATSPGYRTDTPNFQRKIIKDCFACHSSNAASAARTQQRQSYLEGDYQDFISHETLVYGIDCERCHGPAAKHVAYHRDHPDAKTAFGITAFSRLSHQQRLDACALCHSGADGFKMRSRFEFRPGDRLEEFYRVRPGSGEATDVHGNQYGLLIQSQCFLKSPNLDCSTCHSGHGNVGRDAIANSKSCNVCHNTVAHTARTQSEMKQRNLAKNCIECHMPEQGSQAIRFQRSATADMESYMLRSHLIGVYQDGKRIRK